ncbi:hypothetical protein BGZ47_003231, partial [Haplosporangium gracile]
RTTINLQNWSYVDTASSSPTANIWFYFVKGVVCDQPAAFACAFFPQDYGTRTAVYVDWDKFKGKSSKGIAMIMAPEIGHVLGLAHENIDKTDNGDWAKLWKVSPYDKDSVMHSYHDISKELTKTDCRTMSFYNGGFKDLKCGLVGGKEIPCKNYQRNVVKPKDVKLRTNEVKIDTGSGNAAHLEDVADYTCLGSDMSKYILNKPLISGSQLGFVNLGFALTQYLGIRVPSDPDHAYVMQSDGNFVSYNTKTGKAVWSTQSQGLGTKGDYSILFQNDGNLVIYDKKGAPTWGSGSFHRGLDAFRVKALFWQFRDGHMFLTDVAGRSAWASTQTSVYVDERIEAKKSDGSHSGYCLEADPMLLTTFLHKCDGSKYQHWSICTDGTIRTNPNSCLWAPRPGNEERVEISLCD